MKNYLTLTEYAAALGLTRQRVHILIQSNRVRGAAYLYGRWLIPAGAIVAPPRGHKPR